MRPSVRNWMMRVANSSILSLTFRLRVPVRLKPSFLSSRSTFDGLKVEVFGQPFIKTSSHRLFFIDHHRAKNRKQSVPRQMRR